MLWQRQIYPLFTVLLVLTVRVPPSVTYHLREDGKSLIPALEGLCSWGMAYLEKRREADAARL